MSPATENQFAAVLRALDAEAQPVWDPTETLRAAGAAEPAEVLNELLRRGWVAA